MLAVTANEVVTTSELIDWTWGSEPPLSARNVVHSYISRLRTALEAAGSPAEATLQRRHGGYVLEVDEAAVDLFRFRALVAAARSEDEDAHACVRLLREGLDVWRDTALGGVTGSWAAKVRQLLEMEHLSVLVECHERELDLGNHERMLDELRYVARRHPDNEIVLRNLMTALHRAGRRDEALGAYTVLRRRLADHLGVDPAGETQQLHTEIMRSGRTADAPAPPRPADTPAATGVRAAPRVPLQLPRATRLVGREQELAMLDGSIAAAAVEPSIRVIEGPPGVGKTALAIHWAHRVAPRFPDGQIFADLHGSDDDRGIHEPDELIRFILRGLGVQAPDGGGAEDLARLYRETVTGRRLLIVLDDLAEHEAAAELLREVSDATTVVVTARSAASLATLETSVPIRFVRLRELSNRQAERMLAGILGEARVEAEEEAVARLIQLSGRTPQALIGVAEHALGRPHLSLSDLSMTMALEAERRNTVREAQAPSHRDRTYDGRTRPGTRPDGGESCPLTQRRRGPGERPPDAPGERPSTAS
jgi:DNA-binding SARP family transcriptional activator